MEVYHRLRIFDDEDVSSNDQFPFISSTLNITIPTDSFNCSAKYSIKDSTFNSTNKTFNTIWNEISGGSSESDRLYLYASVKSASDGTRVPLTVVKSDSTYNTHSSPYAVNETYKLFASEGTLTDYIDLSDSSIKYIPAAVSAGFNAKIYSTEKILLSSMLYEIYGPFTRSRHKIGSTLIDSNYIPTPNHSIYHITNSHWIDTDKLVACDPNPKTTPPGTYSKAIHVGGNPHNPISVVNAPTCIYPYNEESAVKEKKSYEYRFNAGMFSPESTAGRAFVLRPKVSEEECLDGYRVYVSCVRHNTLHYSTEYNNEYAQMYLNTIWDWVNIQIWNDDTYLSADCAEFSHGSTCSISFKNVKYSKNGTFLTDEEALKKAENTIKIVPKSTTLHTYVIVPCGSRTLICTTELASSINYDTWWATRPNVAYESSFIEGGTRYSEGQNFSDSPDNISMQYKVYASTEVLHDETQKYIAGDKTICDEFHYLTTNTAWASEFTYQSSLLTRNKNNEGLMLYPMNELYTGIKWDNTDYDPDQITIPDILLSPLYSAASIDIIGDVIKNSYNGSFIFAIVNYNDADDPDTLSCNAGNDEYPLHSQSPCTYADNGDVSMSNISYDPDEDYVYRFSDITVDKNGNMLYAKIYYHEDPECWWKFTLNTEKTNCDLQIQYYDANTEEYKIVNKSFSITNTREDFCHGAYYYYYMGSADYESICKTLYTQYFLGNNDNYVCSCFRNTAMNTVSTTDAMVSIWDPNNTDEYKIASFIQECNYFFENYTSKEKTDEFISIPYYDSKQDYNNGKVSRYNNYKTLVEIKKLPTTLDMAPCFYAIPSNLAYPDVTMGYGFEKTTWADYYYNNTSIILNDDTYTYEMKYNGPVENLILINKCPLCSLFSDYEVRSFAMYKCLSNSTISGLHWHMLTGITDDNDNLVAVSQPISQAYGTYNGFSTNAISWVNFDSGKVPRDNWILSAFVKTADIEALSQLDFVQQIIYKFINPVSKAITTEGVITGDYSIVFIIFDYDNANVKTYLEHFENQSLPRKATWDTNMNKYKFSITLDGAEIARYYTEDEIKAFATLDENYNCSLFDIPSDSNIDIPEGTSYIPSIDADVNRKRIFDHSTGLNVVKYSGVSFISI